MTARDRIESEGCDAALTGPGTRPAQARAAVAEAEYADFLDYRSIEPMLKEQLHPKDFEPGVWQRFAPDFVYRYRKVDNGTATRRLAGGPLDDRAETLAYGLSAARALEQQIEEARHWARWCYRALGAGTRIAVGETPTWLLEDDDE